MLRGYRDTQVPFPLSLALPAGSGTITTVLGLVLFITVIASISWSSDAKTSIILTGAAVSVEAAGFVLG